MFTEAWRLERDYFYDRGMHGLDWPSIKAKYQPLVERVTDRDELSDLLAQMVSELSALHIFVRGGDRREGQDQRDAGLARRAAGPGRGGGRLPRRAHLPDRPRPARSPLAARASPAWTSAKATSSRWSTACRRSRCRTSACCCATRPTSRCCCASSRRRAARRATSIAVPITQARENDLRYDEWEYTRRLAVERAGAGQDRLRPPARDGQRRHRAVVSRLLPGLRPRRA